MLESWLPMDSEPRKKSNCNASQKRKQSILNAIHNPSIPAEATAKDLTRAAGFRIVAMRSRRGGVSLPIRALDPPAETR
jgi:hypothetical protein